MQHLAALTFRGGSIKFSLRAFSGTMEPNYKGCTNMLDDKELKQIIIDQNERISKLEEEVKRLSFRVDKLEANPSGNIDNILDGGRMVRR